MFEGGGRGVWFEEHLNRSCFELYLVSRMKKKYIYSGYVCSTGIKYKKRRFFSQGEQIQYATIVQSRGTQVGDSAEVEIFSPFTFLPLAFRPLHHASRLFTVYISIVMGVAGLHLVNQSALYHVFRLKWRIYIPNGPRLWSMADGQYDPPERWSWMGQQR